MALQGLCLELSFSVLYCRTQANLPTLKLSLANDIFTKKKEKSQLRILPIFLSEEGVTHRNAEDYSCRLFRHPFVSQIKIYPKTN